MNRMPLIAMSFAACITLFSCFDSAAKPGGQQSRECRLSETQFDRAVNIALAIINGRSENIAKWFRRAFPESLFPNPQKELELLKSFDDLVESTLEANNKLDSLHNGAGQRYKAMVEKKKAILERQ